MQLKSFLKVFQGLETLQNHQCFAGKTERNFFPKTSCAVSMRFNSVVFFEDTQLRAGRREILCRETAQSLRIP